MRVVDLERDMSDVIPTGVSRDSEHLFAAMTRRTLALARAAGSRILDVASGFGQDLLPLAAQGAFAVGAEPSRRMMAFARLRRDEAGAPPIHLVRSWSDALPFRSGSFDGVICKGAIDHFDRPERAIAEMARVAAPRGRVVLAIANFDSVACRLARLRDDLAEGWLGRPVRRGRRHYDVPADHFTRYDLDLMREQAGAHLELEVVEGVSLGWGAPGFGRLVERLPAGVAAGLLAAADALARRLPRYADVVLLAGRPRHTTAR